MSNPAASNWDNVPRIIESLLELAANDPDFKKLLLEQRARAAETLGLALDPSEAAMLSTVPAAQLEAIIAKIPAFSPPQRLTRHRMPRVAMSLGIQPDLPSPDS